MNRFFALKAPNHVRISLAFAFHHILALLHTQDVPNELGLVKFETPSYDFTHCVSDAFPRTETCVFTYYRQQLLTEARKIVQG